MQTARKIATVFGGTGFLGRHVVQRLAAADYIVRVATRNVEDAKFLRTMGDVGQVVPLYAPLGNEADLVRAIAGAHLVVNLVGILAEGRKGDFMRIHAEGAGRLAQLASAAKVADFIHVSAIGADAKSRSAYARSKAAGEAEVRAAFPRAVILRPSIMFGPEDHFFNRFGAMAVTAPVIPIVHGKTKFQPVYVGDVADAVLAARAPEAAGQTYELGGPEVKSFRELIALTLAYIGRDRVIFDMPVPLARLQAVFLEHLPGKKLTSDQIILLERDNVAAPGMPGLEELGLVPTCMSLMLPRYLARFRRNGKGADAIFHK